MRKYLAILLLLASPCWAEMSGVTLSGVATGSGAAGGETNFCNDANAVGCWYMNGATGAAETDRSSAGNNLDELAGDDVDSSATVPSGYSGKSRDFENADSGDVLLIGDGTELDISGADAKVSVCAWFKAESLPGDGSTNQIAGKYFATGDLRQYRIYIYGTGTVDEIARFKFAFATSSDGTSGGTVIVYSDLTNYVAGTWYHVCGVDNDVDNRIYVNGVLANSSPTANTAGIADKTAYFCSGATCNAVSGYTGLYDGLIDEVIVLNRALSADEVKAIYDHGISGDNGASD